MVSVPVTLTDEQRALKAGVAEICKRYPGEYWRQLDRERAYPEAFVGELTRAGYLAALILRGRRSEPARAEPATPRRAPGRRRRPAHPAKP